VICTLEFCEQLLEFFSGKDPTEPAAEYEDLGGFVWHNDSKVYSECTKNEGVNERKDIEK
jgi:hypothetical protein